MLTDNISLAAEDFVSILPLQQEAAGQRQGASTASNPAAIAAVSTVRPIPEAVAELEKSLIKAALESTGATAVEILDIFPPSVGGFLPRLSVLLARNPFKSMAWQRWHNYAIPGRAVMTAGCLASHSAGLHFFDPDV